MQAPAVPFPGSPVWISYVTAALTLLLIIDLVYRWLEPSRLQVRLTKEVFFRFGDRGEVVFVNAVLLSPKKPVMVTETVVELARRSGSAKKYSMNVMFVGEKVRGGNVLAEHHFFSRSSLEFVPGDVTHRRLYMCDMAEYSEGSRLLIQEFQGKIRSLITTYMPPPSSFEAIESDKRGEFVNAIEAEAKEYGERLFKRIQLETGEYSLDLRITYRRVGVPLFRSRVVTTNSRIEFEIRPGFNEFVRAGLTNCLRQMAVVEIDPTKRSVQFPEYEPFNIKECV